MSRPLAVSPYVGPRVSGSATQRRLQAPFSPLDVPHATRKHRPVVVGRRVGRGPGVACNLLTLKKKLLTKPKRILKFF